MRPADTSPEAWRILLDVYGRMSPDEKIQRVFDLSAFVRSACEAGIRAEYPAASEHEIFLRVTQRTLGDELFKKVYGDALTR